MKTKFCFYSQRNYPHPRTAIEAEILFAARVMQVRFLERLSGKTPLEQNSSGKKIEAESAVPILVYLCIVIMVHKYRQSAKRIRSNKNILFEVFPLTARITGSGKTKPFEKRRSRYKETAENKAEAYRVYVEHLFSACDAVDARIFSKGEMDEETGLYYYGARYLDPKYSRWLSGDPALSDYIPKAPIDDEAKNHNENLPGMGGVFNVVNLHLYHYAGNNPVKYTDPDGREQTDTDIPKVTFSLNPQKLSNSYAKMDSNLYDKSLIDRTAENSSRKQAFEKSFAFLKAPAEKNTKSFLEHTIETNAGTLALDIGKQLVSYTSSDNKFRSECKFNGKISMNGITIDTNLSMHVGNKDGGISMHTEVNTSSKLSFKHPLRDSRSEITLFRVYLQMDYKRR